VSSAAAVLIAGLALVPAKALAACPIELATYATTQGNGELEFSPTRGAATVSNSFRVLLDDGIVLDGIVQWSNEAARPNGMLMHGCPEGDATGDELEACTVWQGVIYTSDRQGTIALLPAQGMEAPQTLILPDLGPSLRWSSVFGAGAVSTAPWDVFALKGCQE